MLTPQYNTNLLGSFNLFLDHEILSVGNGFTNYSGTLFPTTDPNFSQYNLWGSPFKQFVGDSSISGANIISGAFNNGNFIPRNVSGLSVDFLRGRVLSSTIDPSVSLTASFAVKDFNIYQSNVDEDRLLFELAPKLPNQSKIGVAPRALNYLDLPYPCIFYREEMSENKPFALGGMDDTRTIIKCIILSDYDWRLDACLSILRDSARKFFPCVTGDQLPYNQLGDIKNFSEADWQDIPELWQNLVDTWNGLPEYNYNFMVDAALQNQLVYIEDVKVRKFSEKVSRIAGDSLCLGLAEYTLSHPRFPH